MRSSWLLAALFVASWLAAAGPAAAISEDEAANRVAEAYDVQVLKVAEGEIDGQAVWLLTVMKGGGNRNDAFQVSTLAVDRDSGYDLPPKPATEDSGAVRPDAMRGGVWH
jgi:hypothetical protein